MPLLGTRGAASAKAFGLTGATGPAEISPFLSRVSSPSPPASGMVLFSDGSVLISVDGSFTVLNKTTHTPGSSKQINCSIDYYYSNSGAESNTGTLSYINGFARVSNTNTVIQKVQNINSFYWGGNPGATSVYDPISGSTFIASGLYADSGSSAITPHVRRISSSNTLLDNLNVSSVSSYNSTQIPISSAVNSSYYYLMTFDYGATSKPMIWRFSTSSSSLSSATAFTPSISSSSSTTIGITTDQSGNLYIGIGDSTNGGSTLFKYNSSMTTKLASVNVQGAFAYAGGVSVDPLTGDVFWLIQTSNSQATLLKTDSNLIPQFRRSISISSSGYPDRFGNLQVVSNVVAFINSGVAILAVLPKDGTKTGSYSVGGASFTYSTQTLPTYSTVSANWSTTTGYSTSRAFTTSVASESTGTAFSVSSTNI